jgi:hypothetical protein
MLDHAIRRAHGTTGAIITSGVAHLDRGNRKPQAQHLFCEGHAIARRDANPVSRLMTAHVLVPRSARGQPGRP